MRSLRGVLVLTGDLHDERSRSLAALRPDAVLQKPISIDLLVTTLAAFASQDPAEPPAPLPPGSFDVV